MRFLIDRMHEELNRVYIKPGYKEMKFDHRLSVTEQSELWYKHQRTIDDSFMSDLFEGQLVNRTLCLSCGH